jgi:hypothetical protein
MPLKADKREISTPLPSPFVRPTPLSRVRQLNNDADEQKTLAHRESDSFFPFRFQVSSGKTSRLFEIALVFVRLDHVASVIVNALIQKITAPHTREV